MNENDPNVQLIEGLLRYLGDLRSEFVFIGGCATGLLITDSARPPVRATTDIDLVTEVASRTDYYQLADKLRALGFKEDPDANVICRWRIDELQVDVMPTIEEILGFSNRWYRAAVRTAFECTLPSGESIHLIHPPVFLATKLEAFYDRGENDYGLSHDMEDIVTVIDGRPEIVEEVLAADEEVQRYLREEFDSLLSETEFMDSIGWHLRSNAGDQGRIPIIIERLRFIAGL